MGISVDDLKRYMIEAGIDADTVGKLDPTRSLFQQGLDSFDFPAFLSAVETYCQVSISEQQALELTTLDAVVAFIAAHKP